MIHSAFCHGRDAWEQAGWAVGRTGALPGGTSFFEVLEGALDGCITIYHNHR